jgi:hypothetical protein
MAPSASVSHLGSEFDNFLFASIGESRNGMLLSVLSALARLDLDPWQEAAELARLPGKAATQRLTSLISEIPEVPSASSDAGAIAARLVALLPRKALPNIPSREALLGAGATTKSRTLMYVIFMIFALAIQWVAAGRQPPARVNNAHAPPTSTALAKDPPPNSGQ